MLRFIRRLNLDASLIIVVVIVAFLLVSGYPLLTMGWELKTDLVALKDAKTVDILKLGQVASVTTDLDQALGGYPTVSASVSGLKQVNAYDSNLSKRVEKLQYVIDIVEYNVDVQVRTLADVVGTNGYWKHETILPANFYYYLFPNEVAVYNAPDSGKPISGSLFVRIADIPWGTPDFGKITNYTYVGYWLGIIDVVMTAHEVNEVENVGGAPPANPNLIKYGGWSRSALSDGCHPALSLDDGTYATPYTPIPRDPDKILDPDLDSVVIAELPFDLNAGAYALYDTVPVTGQKSGIHDVKPIDYYITYHLLITTVQVKTYSESGPITNPDELPISDPKDFIGYTAGTEINWGFWIMVIIVVIVIMVILGFLGISIISLMFGG